MSCAANRVVQEDWTRVRRECFAGVLEDFLWQGGFRLTFSVWCLILSVRQMEEKKKCVKCATE